MSERSAQRRPRERGSVIVEFSISILVLWLILAATLDFGRAFAASHLLQSAARAASRELALRSDLPWNASFEQAIGAIFDPSYLVVDATCLEQRAQANGRTPGDELDAVLRSEGLLLNRMLRPLMIFEEVTVGGQQRRLLRYPGALLQANDAPAPSPSRPCVTPFIVAVPQIDDAGSRVQFHAVVEEFEVGAFSMAGGAAGSAVGGASGQTAGGTSGGVLPGTVSIRLHYPFQAVGLSAWRIVDGVNKTVSVQETEGYQIEGLGAGGPDATTIDALDAMAPDGALQAYAQRGVGDPIPIHAGRLGLGAQAVLGRQVRPFRRVITAQAIAAREVVGLGS